MAPSERKRVRFGKALARVLLSFDAFIDSSMFNAQRRTLQIWRSISEASERLRLVGLGKVVLDLTCEAVNLGLVGLIVLLAFALPSYRETSDEDWLKRQDLAVNFLDRYGVEVGRRGIKHDDAIPFDELPDHFIKAVLATEDRRFFTHFGIDVIGTVRALTVSARSVPTTSMPKCSKKRRSSVASTALMK